MKKTEKQFLQQCWHCGNKGLLAVVGKHEQHFYTEDEPGNRFSSFFHEVMYWYLLSCPVCQKITLFQKYTSDAHMDETGKQLYEEEILYPETQLDFVGVPEKIKAAFESALKIKSIDTSLCVLSLRRTLELICRDKGADGNNLDSLVKDLVGKNILPLGFDHACALIRQLGNQAAHAKEVVFYKNEVEFLIGFLRDILNYLYSLPKKIENLRLKTDNKSYKKIQ